MLSLIPKGREAFHIPLQDTFLHPLQSQNSLKNEILSINNCWVPSLYDLSEVGIRSVGTPFNIKHIFYYQI